MKHRKLIAFRGLILSSFIAAFALGCSRPSVVATSPASPSPKPTLFAGKTANLPQTAQEVLDFKPPGKAGAVNGSTIAERVYENCGDPTADYVDSDEFPGQIEVQPQALGWKRVIWTIPKCDYYNRRTVILTFEISVDGKHMKYLDNVTYSLAH